MMMTMTRMTRMKTTTTWRRNRNQSEHVRGKEPGAVECIIIIIRSQWRSTHSLDYTS
jgi:hypothetical protein